MVLMDIKLNHARREHLYVQLYKGIKKTIEAGDLLANEKLPPIRAYAKALNVNNVTVVNAYKLLEQEGLVYKKIGSGTYVREREKSFLAPLNQYFNTANLMQQVEVHYGINMASTTPSGTLFPVDAFKTALVDVLDRDKGGVFVYRDSRGYQPLRKAIVETILKPQGIAVLEEEVQIISGAQQGIDVVAKALIHYGDAVVVESPTYTGAIASFKSRGARILEWPIDENGPNIMALRAHVLQYKPKLFYMMPNLQNPTGYVYDEAMRCEIIELCQRHHVMILEDDYCSELNFSNQQIHPLKTYDQTDNVIYIKSFSKVVMPGLRLGFMTVPKVLSNQVMMAKQSTDINTSGLTQRAFESFIRSGEYKNQATFMYQTFKEKYILAKDFIYQYLMPYCEIFATYGGFSFWLKRKDGASSEELYQTLKMQGVLIAAGQSFYVSKQESPYFRITIADLDNEAIVKGIKAIAQALDCQNQTYHPLL